MIMSKGIHCTVVIGAIRGTWVSFLMSVVSCGLWSDLRPSETLIGMSL
jgi:hypothetical protein